MDLPEDIVNMICNLEAKLRPKPGYLEDLKTLFKYDEVRAMYQDDTSLMAHMLRVLFYTGGPRHDMALDVSLDLNLEELWALLTPEERNYIIDNDL